MPAARQLGKLLPSPRDADSSQNTAQYSRRISAIDGLRAWAVLLVFAVHFAGSFALSRRGIDFNQVADAPLPGAGNTILYWIFYSHYGVQIFFVISGFVISRNFAANQTWSDFFIFLAHRAIRIYPAFLISLTVAILVSLHYSWIPAVSLTILAQNLIFLNGAFALHVPAYNNVTWSLFFEFIYYIVFPLLYLFATRLKQDARSSEGGTLLWLIFIAGLWLTSFGEWFLFLSFLFGSWAGLQTDVTLSRLSDKLSDSYLLAAYLVVTTLACIFLPLPRLADGGFIWPLGSPIFVLCLSVIVTLTIVRVSYSDGLLKRVLTISPMLALGRISFSFFLVHVIVLNVIFQMTEQYTNGSMVSAAALALGALLASIVVATVLYEVAERPYYLWRRRAARRHRR